MAESFDVVVVGTGFASTFFLHRFLTEADPKIRVLVLEAGPRKSHQEQLQDGLQKDRARFVAEAGRHFVNRTPEKEWVFSVAFGGGSNCWWGNTPRMLPSDFLLRTKYGVGADWPFDYESLEPFYCDAEEIMSISGPETSPAPRSRPYPQPPHRMSAPDERLASFFEGQFFPLASARARVPTKNRPGCCASSVCRLCPVDAKFTILNELSWLYQDPRVTLRLGAKVLSLETSAGRVERVRYRHEGGEQIAQADLVVLGANAIFNPHLLLASGLAEGGVGSGLVEQVSRSARVYLDGLDNFQGSTSHTGHGYMFYDGEHRRSRSAALVETSNVPELRNERGKWRQFLSVKLIYEDLRQATNTVRSGETEREKPEVSFTSHSEYAERALERTQAEVEKLLAPLPVERFELSHVHPGEAHIMGTTVMGNDPTSSVVDGDCIHHRLRNLLVLGSSTFPTASPANPTLTIAAISLRAAARLFASEKRP